MATTMNSDALTYRALRAGTPLLMALAILAPRIAHAEETATFLRAPAKASPPAVSFAVTYELRFQVANEAELPDLLLQAGVNPDDIAAASRLAAGHLGGSAGGFVKVSVSKTIHDKEFSLQRVTLMTETSQTVMERRKGELTISATGARKRSNLV